MSAVRILAPSDPRHGSDTGYRYGCRCDSCRAAHTARGRAYREANREKLAASKRAYYQANKDKWTRTSQWALTSDDPRHGTLNGYTRYACRCEPCRIAARAHREADREKIAAYKRAHYEANREKIAARSRVFRNANREKIAASKRAYSEANREKIAASKRAYRQATRDWRNAYDRRYRDTHREQIAATIRSWLERHPHYGRDRARRAKRKAIRKEQESNET